jgi:hypothetical protein
MAPATDVQGKSGAAAAAEARIDLEGKVVTIVALEAGVPPWQKIALNIEAQRIAAHMNLPTRDFKRLMEEYPAIVEPAQAYAALKRELGKGAPPVAEFLEEWDVVTERPDPTSSKSPGRSP